MVHFPNCISFAAILFVVSIVSLPPVAYSQQVCPPSGFDAVDTLDLSRFVGDRWYSIRQLPVNFQPEDQFNCVFAQYSILESPYTARCRLFGCTDPDSITVFNSARDGSTSGRPVSVNFRAILPDADTEPAKANVGPRFIPNFVRGSRTNYWVAAVGQYNELPTLSLEPASDQYEWAIITTGPPESVGTDTTKCYSNGGMWFFSRRPVPPVGYVEAMTTIATDLGLDASVLLPVNHDGCDYENQRAGILSNTFTLFTGLF
jgi:lipocalin